MSLAYYKLYERVIKAKTDSVERITEKVDDAHNKGRLTDAEYSDLVKLIGEVYAVDPATPTEE